MTPSFETEAKFSIPDPETFGALRQLSKLEEFQLEPVGTKKITDRYLDTANRHFLKVGYAFRVRQSGEKQLATLKALTPPEGHVYRRHEAEVAVESEQPKTWPDSEAKTLALKIAAGHPPELLFVLHQIRHQFHVLLEERPILELSLDAVSLHSDKQPDFFELEAELLEQGTEAHLSRFSGILQANWPLKPQLASKFERGLDAKFGPGLEEK